jgi:hypothetical protein
MSVEPLVTTSEIEACMTQILGSHRSSTSEADAAITSAFLGLIKRLIGAVERAAG